MTFDMGNGFSFDSHLSYAALVGERWPDWRVGLPTQAGEVLV